MHALKPATFTTLLEEETTLRENLRAAYDKSELFAVVRKGFELIRAYETSNQLAKNLQGKAVDIQASIGKEQTNLYVKLQECEALTAGMEEEEKQIESEKAKRSSPKRSTRAREYDHTLSEREQTERAQKTLALALRRDALKKEVQTIHRSYAVKNNA